MGITCASTGCSDESRPQAIMRHSLSRVLMKRSLRRARVLAFMRVVEDCTSWSGLSPPLRFKGSERSGHERLQFALHIGGAQPLAGVQPLQDLRHDALAFLL